MTTRKTPFSSFLILHGVVFLVALLHGSVGFAQQNISLKIRAENAYGDKSLTEIIEKASAEKKIKDTSDFAINKSLQEILFKLFDNGYLAAHFDSVAKDSMNVAAYLNPGNQYSWAFVRQGNVDEEFISTSGFREKIFYNKPIYFQQLVKIEWNIIKSCENSGYPFASVKLDSIHIANDSISGSLNLNKGKLFTIDSVVINGTAEISDVYVRNYIGIKPGDVYNENLIKQISSRVREIPFFNEEKPTQIEFTENTCKIILHLAKRKASQINGVVGVSPDEQNPGKVFLTGDFQLKLANPFGGGETIDVSWKSPGKKTQDLKTRLMYPFIVSHFGLDLGFDVYKKDTTYVDVTKELGIQYLLPRGNYMKAFVNNKTSSLQSVEGLENVTVLPSYADVSSTLYGIGIRSEKLDYKLNPRKGTSIEATAGTGTRVITKNTKINPEVYDSINLKSVQYRGKYSFDYFIPIRSRTVLNFGLKGGHLINNQIFKNELFRLGGLNTLRGFDEESILASSYDILKVELRYLLEENSFFALFWNGAYYENQSYNYPSDRYDTPYGFGAGITFETKLGIFSVNYALGKQFNNPINFTQGKIHFGLINSF